MKSDQAERAEITDPEIEWFRDRLLQWFAENRRDFPWRRRGASVYEKVIAEVFLQRTTATNVASILPGFVKKFPSWEHIVDAPEDELVAAIQPLGLWRRRVPALRRLATEMVGRGGVFPATRAELENLPAVGQYIANAILLSCFGESEPLLDVNMARVLERYFGPRQRADIRYDPYLQALSRRVIGRDNPEAVNLAILDFAAAVCRSRYPLHDGCPLRAGCKYGNRRELLEPLSRADEVAPEGVI